MTGTALWLMAITLIVVGLLIYFYSVVNEEKRRADQQAPISRLEDEAKELVVTCLTSPDPYQRQAMARQLAEFASVDEVVLQILQELADGDEDEGVRKTAQHSLLILDNNTLQ